MPHAADADIKPLYAVTKHWQPGKTGKHASHFDVAWGTLLTVHLCTRCRLGSVAGFKSPVAH